MTGDAIRTNVLSAQIIPNAEPELLKKLEVFPGHRSLGIPVSYTHLDVYKRQIQGHHLPAPAPGVVRRLSQGLGHIALHDDEKRRLRPVNRVGRPGQRFRQPL